MKSRQTLVLLIFGVSLAACQKESPVQSISNASSQENSVAAGCKTCRDVDPSDFVKKPSNPYFPLVPGTSFHFVNRIIENNKTTFEHVDVTVTSNTKLIIGVTCAVVHDVVKQKGSVTEDTYDWYAEDKDGNLWYFGEDTKALTNHGWSTKGSWEAGVNGACPGIAMWADPQAHIDEIYYQEFLKGVAEDQGQVVNTNVTVKVPYGTFDNCVETKEYTRLEPGVIEHKYYKAGVGQLKTVMTKGGNELEVLTGIRQ